MRARRGQVAAGPLTLLLRLDAESARARVVVWIEGGRGGGTSNEAEDDADMAWRCGHSNESSRSSVTRDGIVPASVVR